MSKFFIPKENISADSLIITGEDVKHISKVLRMEVGDEILCCDGQGNDYIARISSMGSEIRCEITEKQKSDTESNLHVILIQGVPKGSKMDYIIEKTTELGICEIYPCELSRCISKMTGQRKSNLLYLKKRGFDCVVKTDDSIDDLEFRIEREVL